MKQTLNDLCAGRDGFRKFRVRLNEFECLVWAADATDAMRDARTVSGVQEVSQPVAEEVAADFELPEPPAEDAAEDLDADSDADSDADDAKQDAAEKAAAKAEAKKARAAKK